MIKVSQSLCSSFLKYYNVKDDKYTYKSGEGHFELLRAHLLITCFTVNMTAVKDNLNFPL